MDLQQMELAISKIKTALAEMEKFTVKTDPILLGLTQRCAELECDYKKAFNAPIQIECVICKRPKPFHRQVQAFLCCNCAEMEGKEIIIVST